MIRFSMIILLAFSMWVQASAQEAPATEKSEDGFAMADSPTYISANSFRLDAEERVFEYQGAVLVRNGDLLMTCERLIGKYDQENRIETLVATTDVEIDKGEQIFASSERAEYASKLETLTLTESPQISQEGSILAADKITLLLAEDRSTAEGNVRVKLPQQDKKN